MCGLMHMPSKNVNLKEVEGTAVVPRDLETGGEEPRNMVMK